MAVDLRSAPGTVSAGQRVRLRANASPNPQTAVAATLTIGGLTATFSVTTEAADSTPNAFSIAAVSNAARGATAESAAFAVAGINVPAAITVTGGEYSIAGGGFTSGAAPSRTPNPCGARDSVEHAGRRCRSHAHDRRRCGFVQCHYVHRRHRTRGNACCFRRPSRGRVAARSPCAEPRRTTPDRSQPCASTASLRLRATATQPGRPPVPLALGANALTIESLDSLLNGNPAAAAVSVTRHARFVLPQSVAIDAANGRALVIDTEARTLYAVSLTTGARSILSNATTPSALTPLLAPRAVALDDDHKRILVLDNFDTSVRAVDPTTGARSILSGPNTPNSNNPFPSASAIVLDDANDRLLVLNAAPPAIIAVDLDTGERTVLSDATTPNGTALFQHPWAMALDRVNDRVLVTNVGPDYAIYAVNLTSGLRSILSDDATPNGVNPLSFPPAIAVDAVNGRALVRSPNLARSSQ